MGILTDHTNPATMGERSNKKRSSEEIKVTKLIKLFKDKGLLPPTPFGIPEHYGLPITTTAGVRHIVRTLDLKNIPLPSIRRAIDEVVNWAT
jgi:hypothetical protein